MGYPPGAVTDSRAPFNQHEEECPDCNGSGRITIAGEEFQEDCETCNGTGVVECSMPNREEREYDKYDEFDHE